MVPSIFIDGELGLLASCQVVPSLLQWCRRSSSTERRAGGGEGEAGLCWASMVPSIFIDGEALVDGDGAHRHVASMVPSIFIDGEGSWILPGATRGWDGRCERWGAEGTWR